MAGTLALLVVGAASAQVASREARPRQPINVVFVPGLTLGDLPGLANRGAAVGLLVPQAGPWTSEHVAYEAMIRGLLYNGRLGREPRGHILIDAHRARTPPNHGPTIIVGLPSPLRTSNDRRYPIAVFGYGYHCLLVSPLTRVPGLVSMADVVPTALQWQRPLRAERGANCVGKVLALEQRVDVARAATLPSLIVVVTLVLLLALLRRGAAPAGLAAALVANLALGAVDVGGTTQRVFLVGVAVAFGGVAGVWLARRPLALGLSLVAVLGAYLVVMAAAPWVLSLAPISPELTSRFYGISNVVETLLLVPALLGAKLLGERLGSLAFVGVACLALVTIAENRFGDDGGGAIVLGVAYAALGVRMRGRGWRAFLGALAGAGALVYALASADAAISGPNHLRGALSGGVRGLLDVAGGRVPLSYERALEQWWFVFPLLFLVLVATLVLRGPATRGERALATAWLAAVGVSLLVNDTPGPIALAAAAGVGASVEGALHRQAAVRRLRSLLRRPVPVPTREPVGPPIHGA